MNVVYHADHVLVGDGSAIADGAVVVSTGGGELPEATIVEVGRAEVVLPRHAGAPVSRHRGVVFPGLVNAHTHIELSALRGRVAGGRGFVPWVDALIRERRGVDPEAESFAIDEAIDELSLAGTVAVGEITNSLAAVPKLLARGIGGVAFHEVFGHDLSSTTARVASLAEEKSAKVPDWDASELSYAPAPHTLYTTHPDVVRALLGLARAHGARTSLHFAEHAQERRAIEQGDGPVVDWLVARTGLRPTFPKLPLVDYADALGALAQDVLLVHLTDARPDELSRIAAANAPVVLCPRSNLGIELRLPPLLAILEAGIVPGLGTDSLASSPSLDVLQEARSLADRFPSVSPSMLVRMATEGGARALGRSDLGRLAKGTRPGLVHIEGACASDPSAFVLAHVRAPRRVLVTRTRVTERSSLTRLTRLTRSEPSS